MMRNKVQPWKCLFPIPLLLSSTSSQRCRQSGNRDQFNTCCFSSFSERGVLPLVPCGVPSTADSSPWTSPTWLHHKSSILPRLLQHGSRFHRVQSFKYKLLRCGSLSPWIFTGSQPPPVIPLLWCGSPPQAAGEYLPPCGPPWIAGTHLPHCGLHHGLQRNLSSNTWSSSSPFSTYLGVCRVVPHMFSPRSSLATIATVQ